MGIDFITVLYKLWIVCTGDCPVVHLYYLERWEFSPDSCFHIAAVIRFSYIQEYIQACSSKKPAVTALKGNGTVSLGQGLWRVTFG